MNRDIVWTTRFKKDYKLAVKRHLNIELLDDIIRADWLLIYRIDDDVLVLTLARTGTHSDLFGQ